VREDASVAIVDATGAVVGDDAVVVAAIGLVGGDPDKYAGLWTSSSSISHQIPPRIVPTSFIASSHACVVSSASADQN